MAKKYPEFLSPFPCDRPLPMPASASASESSEGQSSPPLEVILQRVRNLVSADEKILTIQFLILQQNDLLTRSAEVGFWAGFGRWFSSLFRRSNPRPLTPCQQRHAEAKIRKYFKDLTLLLKVSANNTHH
jgi:hypothetical protein